MRLRQIPQRTHFDVAIVTYDIVIVRPRFRAAMSRVCRLALLVALIVIGPARAKEGDVLSVGAGVTVTYDDNLLRLPNGVNPAAVGAPTDSRSSLVTNGFVRLILDVPISRQRIRADFTINNSHYSDGYSYLDFTGWEGSAQWLYQLGNNWKGDAYYRRTDQPAGFADYRNFRSQNIQTSNAFGINTDYLLTRSWRLSGGANYTQARNSSPSARYSDLDQWWTEAGIKYESSESNYLRATGRYTAGQYPDRLLPTASTDTEFTQYDLAFDGNWQLSAATRAYGRIAYTNRRFPNSAIRSFNGPTWRVQLDWAPTVKTGVNFLFRREIGATDDITATYVLTQGPRISPYWLISTKVRLDIYYDYVSRDYEGEPVVFSGAPPIEDRYQYAGLGFTWTPTTNWLLRAGYRYGTRRSNYPTRQFDDNSAYGTVQFLF